MMKWGKAPSYNYKKSFSLRKFTIILKSNDEAIEFNSKIWFKQKKYI